jgi:rhodanese-related sulfurtransferase
VKRAAPALAIVFAALALATTAAGEPPTVTPEQLSKQLASDDPPLVLDVRTDGEWEAGHIPGAMHIPLGEMQTRRDEVPMDRDVVVHCQVAPRARQAEKMLIMVGHENVYHLEGGYSAWHEAGLPSER